MAIGRLVPFSLITSALAQIVMLATAHAKPCTPAQIEAQRDDVKGDAATKYYADVTCDLTLDRLDVITRVLRFEGDEPNGITVDCNHATLNGGPRTINADTDMIVMSPKRNDIRRALQTGKDWARPENIVIKNCNVVGSIRLYGMSSGGRYTAFGQSSRCEGRQYDYDRTKNCAGHTARAQAAAPSNIEFRGMIIDSHGRTPLYLHGGVNHVRLIDSELTGEATSVAIYLDAETSHNVIQNNYIHVAHVGKERPREQIAVDGSAYNQIIGNRFAAINNGGIYLYRNCGERGEVRHQAPQYNRIINNVFYYDRYEEDNPAIWLGSRNDPRRGSYYSDGKRPDYCQLDDGIPFGSGASDDDFARHNVIADNRIIKRRAVEMIRADDGPNEYHNITTVASGATRPSSCYDYSTFPHAYLAHAESTPFTIENGAPVCRGVRNLCNDGLIETGPGLCPLAAPRSLELFECRTAGSNTEVECTASCPEGYVIESAKAACNLETDEISIDELSRQGWGTLEVQRASDNIEEGRCRFGRHDFNRDVRRIADVRGARSVSVACREHDKNGGDCVISGVLACVGPRTLPQVTPKLKRRPVGS
jgi:hypothetical protein